MKRINVKINDIIVWSSYKRNEEYQAWIDSCVAANLWGEVGTYVVEVLDADAELEAKRQSQELTTKTYVSNHIDNVNNPHSVTKLQVGLGNVDDTSDLSKPISTATQSAIDGKQQIGDYITELTGDISAVGPGSVTATLVNSGVVAGTYNTVTVDTKGRVTVGSNSGPITRYSYFTSIATSSTSATPTTVAELTTVSLPIGLYKFFFACVMRSTQSTSGVGLRIQPVTAVLSTVSCKWNISQGVDGVSHDFEYDQNATTTNITSVSVAAANTNFAVNGMGIFRVTTAGTIAIQFRPETNGQTATIQPDASFSMELV